MKVRAGQGSIDWGKIVEYKKKKKADVEALAKESKSVQKLDRRYNCVKHV